MPKAYSLDLRERVVKAYLSGKTSTEVAEIFSVSHDFVSNMVNKYQEKGSLETKKIGGYVPHKIRGEDLNWLKDKLTENSDLTIKALIILIAKERKVKASYTAMRKAILRLNFSFKKRAFLPPKN